MNLTFRHAARLFGATLLFGTSAAAIAHGEFHSMLAVGAVGLQATAVLLVTGAVLRCVPRARRTGTAFAVAGIATFAAIPVAFVAAGGVVAIDRMRAQRYVTSQLVPRLEQIRVARGRYPTDSRLLESARAGAPWLIRRFSYGSDGDTYRLEVMDPGVCGRVTTYSSVTRTWTESYDPCWY